MPCEGGCNSVKPSVGLYERPYEAEIKALFKHVLYLLPALKILIPTEALDIANFLKYKGDKRHRDYLTNLLCSTIKKMSVKKKKEVIYDGSIKEARRLADWWDEHQEVDRKRMEEEKKKRYEAKLRKSAIAKLTQAERKVLGL